MMPITYTCARLLGLWYTAEASVRTEVQHTRDSEAPLEVSKGKLIGGMQPHFWCKH